MSVEYALIAEHYGDRTAKRSGVRLMDHIDQGLAVLEAIGAVDVTQRAFCLHPLLQDDEDLLLHYPLVCVEARPAAILLAMEYRHWANAWLSGKVSFFDDQDGPHLDGYPSYGPMLQVRDMLIADKVQNYKDFLEYHAGTHARSAELEVYFNTWFEALNITPAVFKHLCNVMEAA